ncbi:MAG: acyl-CoA dehydrogenase family protein, partial [Desulfobacterales bacterium]|nr:acyl-CoA dehydrogenase family protein [Desulfobacterales bacterium]
MDLLKYTEEHDRFREELRAFLKREVTPNVDQWEKDKIEPKSIWRKMGKAGFLCPSVAKEYGGRGGDFLYSIIMSEEMSRTMHTGLAAG